MAIFLCFPHLGILRLIIGHGIVPLEWSRRAVQWAIDAEGRLWLQLPCLPPRTVQEKLLHFGVSWQKELPPLRYSQSRSWAEILPLERNPNPVDPTVGLVCVEGARLAALLRCRYVLNGNFQIIYHDYAHQKIWGLLSPVPSGFVEQGQSEGGWQVYTEQVERRWVVWGYQHPLIEHIIPPRGGICILHESGQIQRLRIIPGNSPSVPVVLEEQKRPVGAFESSVAVDAANIRVRLPLRWSSTEEEKCDPSLWYIPEDMVTQFWQRCEEVNEVALCRVDVALIQTRQARGLVVWAKGSPRSFIFDLPRGAVAYVVDPEIPQLFWPVGWKWRPWPGCAERLRQAKVHPDYLTWVEKTPDGTARCHQVVAGVFRALTSVVEYTVPPLVPLRVAPLEVKEETLRWSVSEPECRPSHTKKQGNASLPPPQFWTVTRRVTRQPTSSAKRGSKFWQWCWNLLGRHWWQYLASLWKNWWRPRGPQSVRWRSTLAVRSGSSHEEGMASASAPYPPRDVRNAKTTACDRDETPQLPQPSQWLLTALESQDAVQWDEGWAELARWQQLSGRGHDAALCWLMALWESRPQNLALWSEQWWLAELRLARVSQESAGSPEFWQQRLADVSLARLAAASLVRLAVRKVETQELNHLLPPLIQIVEIHAGELPLRAVWLAACAAFELSAGHILLLARRLDDLMKRISQPGHATDLDIPSFLRFLGSNESEHLTAACSWLLRQRHQMLSWVLRQPVGPLRVEGLDGETTVTSQIASLLWAWGLAAVGERRGAEVWWSNATASSEGLDEEVSAALQCVGAIVRWRMHEVLEGHPVQPEFPHDWRTQRQSLSRTARYAVERLCEYSRIIDPFRLSRPLRCWELAPLRCDDPLGERLMLLLERVDVEAVSSEADELLRVCDNSGNDACSCRILIALCELAAVLPIEILERLVKRVPLVWECLPAFWPETKGMGSFRVSHLRRHEVSCRVMENLTRAMLRWPAQIARPYLAELWQYWRRHLPELGSVMLDEVPLLAYIFRRFDLHKELEQLAEDCWHALSRETSPNPHHRLAGATVWAALEETDVSDPILDAVRDCLFLSARGPEAELSPREYTRLAYGYAAALAFMSSRRRLGRYEELFQRLRPLDIQGSTNRYWTLQPLHLVDIVVRGVIGEVYRPAPQIQQWLALQDMRFRQRVYRDTYQRQHSWESENFFPPL